MPRRKPFLVAAIATIATIACTPTAFTTITNGGGAVAPGACADASIADKGGGMRGFAAGAAGCEAGTGFLVPEGAAAIVWQLDGAAGGGADPKLGAWLGPVVSNVVSVRTPDRPKLVSGGDAKDLASGGDAKAFPSGGGSKDLASGGDAKSFPSGGDVKSLPSGGGSKDLASGGDAKSLPSGGGSKDLASGGGAKGLPSGGGSKDLASGGDAKGLPGGGAVARPPVELRKEASRDDALPGDTIRYALVAKNLTSGSIRGAVIVDRISSKLTVTATDGATTQLPDGSTLVVWTLQKPLAPSAEVRVEVTTTLR